MLLDTSGILCYFDVGERHNFTGYSQLRFG
jgi:hypothetical protein